MLFFQALVSTRQYVLFKLNNKKQLKLPYPTASRTCSHSDSFIQYFWKKIKSSDRRRTGRHLRDRAVGYQQSISSETIRIAGLGRTQERFRKRIQKTASSRGWRCHPGSVSVDGTLRCASSTAGRLLQRNSPQLPRGVLSSILSPCSVLPSPPSPYRRMAEWGRIRRWNCL